MEIYDLLTAVCDKTSEISTYYFDDEKDAEVTLGGHLICGKIESGSYVVSADQPLIDDVLCDFVIYDYATLHYGYRIEE